jgi:HAD superfamily hydrolase (TIGR01509 family)
MASVGPLSLPKSGFDAVIFDCDGTLVDSMSAHFEAWCEALAIHGAGGIFKEDVFFAMGGRPTRDIVVEINDEYDLKLDPEAVAFAKRESFLKRIGSVTLIDEVAEFARELRGKVPMAVASGGTRMVVEKTLRAAGISDWFDEVVTADDVKEGKPAPDIFLHTARLLGVLPSRCLALEDAPAGIMAAQSAGMRVIAVPSPLSSSSVG